MNVDPAVWSDVVWHMVQPAELKFAWPFLMDCDEGLSGIPWVEGVGGARNRENVAKATTSLGICAPELSKLVWSSGRE